MLGGDLLWGLVRGGDWCWLWGFVGFRGSCCFMYFFECVGFGVFVGFLE